MKTYIAKSPVLIAALVALAAIAALGVAAKGQIMLAATLIGAVAGAWFQDAALGGVIAAAMIVNLLVAGTAGIAIPLGLQRLGADPALASAVFLTTVTDIVGFLAFLGLASLVLLG